MRRSLQFLLGAIVGLAVGGGAMLATARPPVESTTSSTASTTVVASTVPSPPPTTATESPVVLLVWTPGGLADELVDRLGTIGGVETVSVARTDLASLSAARNTKGATTLGPEEGLVIPVEVTAIDDAFARLVPGEWQETIAGLTSEAALLSETSAEVRGIEEGGTLTINGAELWVAAVLPDIVLGGAEIVVSVDAGEPIGVVTPRYALVGFEGDRAEFEDSVREMLPSGVPVRVRAPGETPFLRNGDAVLPQAHIKKAFGEFAIRWSGGGDFEIDPSWVEQNIVTEEVPLLGATTCHVAMMPSLQGAMTELEQANLGFLVKTFHGCFNPRFIGGTLSLSRHAWGVAVDINYTDNVTGQTTTQDARLVETLERWGFTWGGNWLIPDAAHFEWVAPPRP